MHCLRSDNGSTYTDQLLRAYCRTHNILQEFAPPFCASANGCSEVYWRETFKFVRALLWDQQRDGSWWPSALHFSDVLRNHLLTSSVPVLSVPAAWTASSSATPLTPARTSCTTPSAGEHTTDDTKMSYSTSDRKLRTASNPKCSSWRRCSHRWTWNQQNGNLIPPPCPTSPSRLVSGAQRYYIQNQRGLRCASVSPAA